jgi:hypothetical protein
MGGEYDTNRRQNRAKRDMRPRVDTVSRQALGGELAGNGNSTSWALTVRRPWWQRVVHATRAKPTPAAADIPRS